MKRLSERNVYDWLEMKGRSWNLTMLTVGALLTEYDSEHTKVHFVDADGQNITPEEIRVTVEDLLKSTRCPVELPEEAEEGPFMAQLLIYIMAYHSYDILRGVHEDDQFVSRAMFIVVEDDIKNCVEIFSVPIGMLVLVAGLFQALSETIWATASAIIAERAD